MRILRISLRNIASLADTHTIDFTREPLRSAGLFSISGVTGAGKSSLLDALCLALYDDTPRLNPLGRLADLVPGEKQNDPRSLLRRGATDAAAEVAFVGTDGQEYTARWSVRRAHGRTDGNLLGQTMGLCRGNVVGAKGEAVCGSNKSEVLRTVQEKIGLTFPQFTRAVLLAQNDFATFLKADDKARAEILQALTGTEQFERISKAVHQRQGEMKRAVEDIAIRLSGQQPMSAEERAAAIARRDITENAWQTLNTARTERAMQFTWFEDERRLIEARGRALQRQEAARLEQAEAMGRRQELERTSEAGRTARSLRDAEKFAGLTAGNAEVAKGAAAAKEGAARIARDDAEVRRNVAEEARTRVQAEFDAARPLLAKARELDVRLGPLKERLAVAVHERRAANDAADKIARLLNEQRQISGELETERVRLDRRQRELTTYEPFVADATAWMDRLEQLKTLTDAVATANENISRINSQLQTCESQLATARADERAAKLVLDEITEQLASAEASLREFDAGRMIEERQQADQSRQALERLRSGLELIGGYSLEQSNSTTAIAAAAEHQQRCDTELREIMDVLLPDAVKALELAQQILEDTQAVVSAAKLRDELRDGQACPVCGSLEHPYADHPPEADAVAIRHLKATVKDKTDDRDALTDRKWKLEGELSSLAQAIARETGRQAELERKIVDVRSCWPTWLEAARTSPFSPASGEKVADRPDEGVVLKLDVSEQLAATTLRLTEVSERIELLNRRQQQHAKASEDVSTFRKQHQQKLEQHGDFAKRVAELEGDLRQTDTQRALATTEQSRAVSAVAAQQDKLQSLWNALPGSGEECATDSMEFRNRLRESLDDCRTTLKSLVDVRDRLGRTVEEIKHLEQESERAAAELQRRSDDHANVQAAWQLVADERQTLFDGRLADAVEGEFQQRLDEAGENVDKLRKMASDASHACTEAVAMLGESIKAAFTAQSAAIAATLLVTNWLTEFSTRHAIALTREGLDELLSRDEAWLQTEQNALAGIERAVSEADGQLTAQNRLLAEHTTKRPSEDSETVVLAALEALAAELEQAHKEREEATFVVRQDDERAENGRLLATHLAAEQAKFEPWNKLNSLIGSADGSRFRLIAQRYTLDLLLQDANLQLDGLARRYQLRRLPESLNLVVIDRDMGDEVRSVHSLSGGESFLVSLALALGLASLTSNRLRIESLFIDEGFGSLDQETLRIAMDALLRLESQGRKVGVISHVTEMTDAIPVTIEVRKGRGGSSRVVIKGAADEIDASAVDVAVVSPSGFTDDLATRLLHVLQQLPPGSPRKKSSSSLCRELNCSTADLESARRQLGSRVVKEGRSLVLME